MAKGKNVPSQAYKDRLEKDLRVCKNEEERLDLLLSRYRGSQTKGNVAAGEKGYLSPQIKELMEAMGLDRRITETRLSRTEGVLTYAAMALSGAAAYLKAVRIRRAVKKVMGNKVAEKVVTATRKVTWKVDWEEIEKSGPELTETVRMITGTTSAKLAVGEPSQSSKRGDKRKRRAGKK